MLKKENNYDFRKRMSEIHEKNIRDFSLMPETDELEIVNGSRIVIPEEAGIVLVTAAQDFADYLFTSMNVSVSVMKGLDQAKDGDIILAKADTTGDDLGEYASYKGEITTVDNTLRIIGHDERGIAFGIYFAEDMMTFRGAPFIKKGIYPRKPMYYPQMVHSGYGLDEYPNEHLSAIAHQGRDAILIFVKDVDKTPYGYLDFNDLIHRASKYGLDVYAYSYFKSERSYDDPDAEAYYEDQYGKLFQKCPGLKGVTLVGESIGFPSHDPHVNGALPQHTYRDGIPTGIPSAGYYPCEDYPKWLDLLKRIITKYKPDAEIIFWTYNWGFRDVAARQALVRSLPEGITLQATFEMFHHFELDGIVEECADYTVSFAGPGEYFISEAEAAKEAGIKLHSMTNTGGLTWDFGVIPYEPFPYQWIKRYKEMEKAHDTWGLQGLMESHHFGIFPSFISKLSKWAFSEPRIDHEEILEQILKSEFGAENIKKVDKALKLWSEGITHYVASDADQWGAMRVGPSYPLQIDTEIPLRSAPHAHFGSGICFPYYHVEPKGRESYVSLRVPVEIESYKKMRTLINEGLDIMEAAVVKNEKLERLINMGRFISNSLTTGIHAKEMYRLRNRLRASENCELSAKIAEEMEALIKAEITNAENTIPLVEADSRLGWEPSMEYMTDKEHIEWKIRFEKYILDFELPRIKKVINLKSSKDV